MNKQYIADIITQEEISKWQPGNRILICSQTGSGKSEFIKNNLYQYCKNNNKKIILMSNRNLLKNQNLIDIEGKEDFISAHNYQEFETKVLGGFNPTEIFEQYNYIVYDEAHYIFSDSQFNRNTDLLMNPILNTPNDKIFLFITATPQALIDYQSDYNFTYNLKHDYSYIKDIYFYNRSAIAESILQNIPYEEKAIFFGSNAYDTWTLSTKFLDAAFICSEGNAMYNKSSKNASNQIVVNSSFDARILFSTKVLDNGVNIKDSQVRHIIIDMLDPISFIQCLGRKRCEREEDTITLYVKNYHGGNIFYVVNDLTAKIKFVNEFNEMGEKEFKDKYRKRDFDNVIDNDYQVNMAKFQNYITQKRLLLPMLSDIDKIGFKKYICKELGFPVEGIKSGDDTFEKVSMTKLLEKSENKKMFKDEQEKFKAAFFDKLFSPKKTNYRHRGVRSINAILEEDNLPFMISSRQEKERNENRYKTYWIIGHI
jgi:hypothetical protein